MPEAAPLVSVVIPVRNRPAMLARALDSVRAQTVADWEALVIDDGSTDETPARAEALAVADARIRVLRHPESRGASAARNTGLAAARGTWVALLDSDDEWEPRRLEAQFARLDATDAADRDRTVVVYCWYHEQDESGARRLLDLAHEGDVSSLLLAQVLGPTSTLLIRRAALDAVGLFDSRMEGCEEYELLVRLARHGRFAVVREPLATLHHHAQSRHSRNGVGWSAFLDVYGDALRAAHGRRALGLRRRLCGSLFWAQGRRAEALRQFRLALREWPLDGGAWARLCAAAVGMRARGGATA